ncbi:MAG: spermidine/putrescine transport system substrate-binding protein [Candidatus Dependentiae bacterium]|nr:spermidine/putrescine transport system substrate-binding protein [Candidatus Dependentiae bacterium]
MINFRSLQEYGIRLLLVVLASGLLYGFLALGRQEQTEAVTIYAYCDMLSTEDFEEFTAQTGIPVVVRHFEAIEEVITKLVFTRDSGIDIVAPTDSMVEVLREKNLLLPLTKEKLPSIPDLCSYLMGRFYDPENMYTVPFSWTPVGIGYDTRVVRALPGNIGWDIIFGTYRDDKLISPDRLYGAAVDKVCLGEDPFETEWLAMLHLYGSVEATVLQEHEDAVVKLLKEQKAWIECYTNNLQYFLVSGVCPAVVIPGAYMINLREENSWADFVIPEKGSMMYIGNFGISATSKKVAQAHAVIEYMLSKEGALVCYENHKFLPANAAACEALPEAVRSHPYLYPDLNLFNRLYTLHNAIPGSVIERVWHHAMV